MPEKKEKPDCYKCSNRGTVQGDTHSSCSAKNAKVEGNRHGILRGWFAWPFNYDPVWLVSCDSFTQKEARK